MQTEVPSGLAIERRFSYHFDAMIDQRMSLAALSLALTLALVAALPQGRLLGGEDAKVAEFPYVASLRLNKAHVCQAAIISQTQLLTAAHCVSDVGANP